MASIQADSRLRKFLGSQGLVLAFILLMIFFSLASDRFLTYTNMMLVFRQVSVLGTIAIGMTLVIIAGNFDLAVGSLTSFTAVLAITMHDIIGPVPAILITLAVGIASGTVIGFLVGHLRLNSLIITLGFLSVWQAVTLIFTGGRYSSITAPEATWYGVIGRGFVLGVPVPVIILAVLILVFTIVLTRTVFGRYVFAVGGNATASRFSGIKDSWVIMMTFIISGFLTAVAGVMLSSRLMAAQNYLGQGYEFEVIAGVILGGTSLAGGEGNILKAFIGVLIIGILRNGFLLLGLPYYTQWVAQWVIVVGVVWIDVASRRGTVLA